MAKAKKNASARGGDAPGASGADRGGAQEGRGPAVTAEPGPEGARERGGAAALTTPLTLLLVVSLLASLLALFQWMELLVARAGGSLICNVSSALDCEKVWTSPFAVQVHRVTGIPVAGWGLLWGLVAFGQAVALLRRRLAGQPLEPAIAAIRLCAAAGVLTTLALAGVSLGVGSLCLTCLGTYLLVATYAGGAFVLLPGPAVPSGGVLRSAVAFNLALLVPLFALLYLPGQRTGHSDPGAAALAKQPTLSRGAETASAPPDAVKPAASTPPADGSASSSSQESGASGDKSSAQPDKSDKFDLAAFIRSLPPGVKQAISDSLSIYRSAKPVDASAHKVRRRFGPENAPVQLVDFIDIRCGHCRQLAETLKELERITVPGSWSLEPRHYPLDGECNPHVKRTDGSGTSCTAAKALICLDSAPDRKEIEARLFAEQRSLTKKRVLDIAGKSSLGRKALEACIASKATADALADDIAYATKHDIEGTPLVVLNGRKATPVGAFLFAMIMTGADDKAQAFNQLPPPRVSPHGHGHGHGHGGHGHEGHNH